MICTSDTALAQLLAEPVQWLSKHVFFPIFVMQSQVIEFPWDIIQQYEADDEGMSFNFEYIRQGRKPRWVKIYTQYVSIG